VEVTARAGVARTHEESGTGRVRKRHPFRRGKAPGVLQKSSKNFLWSPGDVGRRGLGEVLRRFGGRAASSQEEHIK